MNKRSITLICPYGTQLFDKFDTSPFGGQNLEHIELQTHYQILIYLKILM